MIKLHIKLQRLFDYLLSWYQVIRYLISIYTTNCKKILIVDLDNTLFDTWPLLRLNKSVFISSPPILTGTLQFIESSLNVETKLIFLSHRPSFCYGYTLNILQSIDTFEKFDFQLYFVPKVAYKKMYFKFANSVFEEVCLIDDLTYNHEFGKVLYYNEIIEYVRRLNIKYFDYEFILNINKKEHETSE